MNPLLDELKAFEGQNHSEHGLILQIDYEHQPELEDIWTAHYSGLSYRHSGGASLLKQLSDGGLDVSQACQVYSQYLKTKIVEIVGNQSSSFWNNRSHWYWQTPAIQLPGVYGQRQYGREMRRLMQWMPDSCDMSSQEHDIQKLRNAILHPQRQTSSDSETVVYFDGHFAYELTIDDVRKAFDAWLAEFAKSSMPKRDKPSGLLPDENRD